MFTGLIREMATVKSFANNTLTLQASYRPKMGDSIAINGVCLSVTALFNDGFSVELSPETQGTVALENLKGRVHIEPAMMMGDRFEGHIVQGHVDGVGTLRRVASDGDWTVLGFDAPRELVFQSHTSAKLVAQWMGPRCLTTTVETFDNADVIIPNADLITNQVTNWTLSNRRVRLIIPVGVAYGSDIPLVLETLKACAKTNSMLAQTPEPQVLFLSFGESSLDFELRVWVLDADYRMQVKSELHQEIDRRFREAKIEIAFPQRDLHLRSVDGEAAEGLRSGKEVADESSIVSRNPLTESD